MVKVAVTGAFVVGLSSIARGMDSACGMTESARVDCGFFGVTQEECEGKGCCYAPTKDPSNPQHYPWCFVKPAPPSPRPSPPPSPTPTPTPAPGKACQVAEQVRSDCGFDGVTQESCEAKGCCYVPTKDPSNPQHYPWCFFKQAPTPPSPPTPGPTPGPTPTPRPTPTPVPPAPPAPPPSPPGPVPPGGFMPFTSLQAEHAQCGGRVLGPSYRVWRDFGLETEVASEAVGRMACELRPGQSIIFEASVDFTHFSVRYSLPPGADRQSWVDSSAALRVGKDSWPDLALTSRYGWYYGPPGGDYNQPPSHGMAHRFFDEVRAGAGRLYKKGTEIVITWPASESHALTVDLLDLYSEPDEQVSPPSGEKGVDYLDVTDYGADPSGFPSQIDSFKAFADAISDATRLKVPVVWIPTGRYYLDITGPTLPYANDMTIQGAGMWHSELHFKVDNSPAFNVLNNGHFKDFALIGDVRERFDTKSSTAFWGPMDETTVERVWIQHFKCGMWVKGKPSHNLLVTGVIIRDTAADGINLNGNFIDSVVEHSSFRNTGDDAMALWSIPADVNCTVRYNTIQLPIVANGIAVYGGTDISVYGNVVEDTVCNGGGIHVANRFGASHLKGTFEVKHNVLNRCGAPDIGHCPGDCQSEGNRTTNGAFWMWAQDGDIGKDVQTKFHDNIINDPVGPAMLLRSTNWWFPNELQMRLEGVSVENVKINGGSDVVVAIEAKGGASFASVDATGGVDSNGVAGCEKPPEGSQFLLADGGGNEGWLCKSAECGVCIDDLSGACVNRDVANMAPTGFGCPPRYLDLHMNQLPAAPQLV